MGSVVDASVQVIGNRLRVTVQLLDPVTEAHLWAESYDRTLDDAFAVQSDIARRIVTAVGATVTDVEAGAIAAAPTRNPGAYDFYLQGLAYHRRPGFLRENLLTAQQLYEQAIALDSSFALAHATLASVHVAMYGLRYDRSPTRLELARREAEVALRLVPGLPQAHLATGQRLYVERQLSRCLGRARSAACAPRRMTSSCGPVPAFVQRSLGDWDRAIAAFEHARRLDPRDANLSHQLGDTYHYLRRYQDAIEAYRNAGALAPDLVQPRLSQAWSYFLWKGELDTLRTVLRGLPVDGEPGTGGDSYGDQRLIVLLWERRPDSLLSLLRVMRPAAAMSPRSARISCVPGRGGVQAPRRYRPDSHCARFSRGAPERCGTGQPQRRGSACRPWDGPGGARTSHRGAAGGRLARAVRGRPAGSLRPGAGIHACAHPGAARRDRCGLCTRSSGCSPAPSLFSVHELRLSPDFDPIRSDSRYQALLGQYANAGTSVQAVGANGSDAIGKSVGR